MKRTINWSYEWVYSLAVALLFLAVVLRTLLLYGALPVVLGRDLALLAAWLVLFLAAPSLTRRWRGFLPVYLVVQPALVVLLLLSPDPPDYFAILFGLLSLQAMQLLDPRPAVSYIAVFTPLIAIPLIHTTGLLNALAFALVYTAANALLAFYSLSARRAIEANARVQAMQAELRAANLQLQANSEQLKQLAVARERSRLARDLHDSVTQTVFSMTLTTQSALLLLDRDPGRVKEQLGHLSDLARGALAEMQTLIAELRPEGAAPAGLAASLRQHVAGRQLPDGLTVSVEVQGDRRLAPAEELALFRISQEALNNVVKHAHAARACVSLHLADPLWIEIEDDGRGFDLAQAGQSHGIGLSSMRERAAEIGWKLRVTSAPGAGTHIRVEKEASYDGPGQD
jgi:signal transduction histidine kinase